VSAVGHAVWIDSAPLPVEITNHTEWWVQWLPLVASALVAIATLIGVVLSNRTTLRISRREREDVRQRDFVTWRRKELQRLGTEVVRAARGVIDEYGKAASLVDQPTDAMTLGPIELSARPIAADAEILRFLGAYDAAGRCIKLHSFVTGLPLLKAVQRHKAALLQDRAAGLRYEQPSEALQAAKAELTDLLMEVQVGIRHFGYAIESDLRQLDPPEHQEVPPEILEDHDVS
jgi:hypothetical protein